jgi:hypothetical protein
MEESALPEREDLRAGSSQAKVSSETLKYSVDSETRNSRARVILVVWSATINWSKCRLKDSRAAEKLPSLAEKSKSVDVVRQTVFWAALRCIDASSRTSEANSWIGDNKVKVNANVTKNFFIIVLQFLNGDLPLLAFLAGVKSTSETNCGFLVHV